MLEKNYNPSLIEKSCYEKWTHAGLFKTSERLDDKKSYTIMLPPPNVTGSLHMGHAFQDTLMDALIRRHKQKGFDTLWQVGTDHAGIATQMVVERQLEKEGKTRHDLGREDFVSKVWQWKEHSGGKILEQLKRLGVFIDWDRERFTMDKGCSESVTHAFVKLYREGLIYRKEKLVNWDCHLESAVSDLEVEYDQEKGKLYHLNYKIEQNQGFLQVVTTRPETIFGDVAIAVHPDDERYADMIGQRVLVPIINRSIPIVADLRVDKEFGSGCVKITPAHDFLDFDIGQDHNLEAITVLTSDGKLNEHTPKDFQGLDRIEARPLIAEALKECQALTLEQDYEHQVPRCSRTNQVIEPRLTTQWFLSMSDMASAGLEALDNADIAFVPQMWSKHYRHWLENIQDWCLSRQLWWGHRIPAWYDSQGHIYVGMNEKEVREFHSLSHDHKLHRDPDVLDTWFSSALWPMATLGWPQTDNIDWKKFFPTQVLVTGFDIIFFWVARMIMFSLHFTKKVPFKDIYIHGILQDSLGHKMSKSKGNVIDPCDLIDGISLDELITKRTSDMMQPEKAHKIAQQTKKEFPEGFPCIGTDALRFTFCTQASPGRFIRFDMSKLVASSNFCNKIWNMARFCLMHFKTPIDLEAVKVQSDLDSWILQKITHARDQIDGHYENYRFDLIGHKIYEFTWTEVCDWYIELIKVDLKEENTQKAHMLYYVVLQTLKLMHPVMPFISEEIYATFRTLLKDKTQLPEFLIQYEDQQLLPFHKEQADNFSKIIESIGDLRTLRTRLSFPKKAKLKLYYHDETHLTSLLQGSSAHYLNDLSGIESVVNANSQLDDLATKSLKMHLNHENFSLSLPDDYDVSSQIERFNKDSQKVDKEILGVKKRLENKNFTARAPKEVVEKEKSQLASLEDQKQDLDAIIKQLKFCS